MEEQTTTISDDETEMQETPSKDAASKIMEGLEHHDSKAQEDLRRGRDGASDGGRTQGQKASREQRRWKFLPVYAAFWHAPSTLTKGYGDHWAGQFSTAVPSEITQLQWCHSVLGERSFKSPWQACEEAAALAFKLHPEHLPGGLPDHGFDAIWPKPSRSHLPCGILGHGGAQFWT